MRKYQHSETFKSLKSTKEEISDNLSSAQYLQTLDYFIWNALTPIAYCCEPFFYGYIAKCVAAQILSPNIKYTSDDKSNLPILLFNIINETDKEKKLRLTRKLYLNRGLLFGILSLFFKIVKPYSQAISVFSKIDSIDRTQIKVSVIQTLGADDRLHHVIKEVRYWDLKARSFKASIVQKYTRMAMLQAQKTYVDFNHYEPLDDVSQIYLMIVNKAIDRCDARLGVLTTFIQRWLKTARSQVAKLSRHQTDSSLDELAETLGDSVELGITNPDSSHEDLQELSYRAKILDPVGIVRTHLNIPQYVSLKDKQTLLSLAKAS